MRNTAMHNIHLGRSQVETHGGCPLISKTLVCRVSQARNASAYREQARQPCIQVSGTILGLGFVEMLIWCAFPDVLE